VTDDTTVDERRRADRGPVALNSELLQVQGFLTAFADAGA
jgi:hypothetical protein